MKFATLQNNKFCPLNLKAKIWHYWALAAEQKDLPSKQQLSLPVLSKYNNMLTGIGSSTKLLVGGYADMQICNKIS